jgi:hypothetical protein
MIQDCPAPRDRTIELVIRLGHSRARWRLAPVAVLALLVRIAVGRL